MILNDINEKVATHVLSTCLKKMVECFDSFSSDQLPTVNLINYAYCYSVAYMTYEYAKAHGVQTQIYAGPYHVYLMRDGKIYDVFYPMGVNPQDVKLSESFIELEQQCFGEEEVNPETFDENFYIGKPITDIGYLSTYFIGDPITHSVVNKFFIDNGLTLNPSILGDSMVGVKETNEKIILKNFKVGL